MSKYTIPIKTKSDLINAIFLTEHMDDFLCDGNAEIEGAFRYRGRVYLVIESDDYAVVGDQIKTFKKIFGMRGGKRLDSFPLKIRENKFFQNDAKYINHVDDLWEELVYG